MRGNRAVMVLLTISALAAVTAPVPVRAQSVEFGKPAQLPTAEQAVFQDDDGIGSGIGQTLQHVLIGTAALGGAFTLGFLATGSLSTAITTAGAVAIGYAVLP